MIEVTEAQFFAEIGPQNVTPYPTGRYGQQCDGFRSEWRTPSGVVRGVSLDSPSRFYLPESGSAK